MDTATIIIRVIRSFEYRNIRNLVLKDVSLSITTEELKIRIAQALQVAPGLPPPFRKYDYDTLKVNRLCNHALAEKLYVFVVFLQIESHAHGAKTNDPVINHENDEGLILKPGFTLAESDVRNETEISFFKYEDYIAHKKNPVLKIGAN